MGRGKIEASRGIKWLKFINYFYLNSSQKSCITQLKNRLDPQRFFIFIDIGGEVYGCGWMRHKSLGNAMATLISNLLVSAQDTPYFKALNEGGIRQVALLIGLTEKEIKKKLRFKWECDFCEELTEIFKHKEATH